MAQGTNWADAVTQAYIIACFRATHAHSGTICSHNNNKARGSSPHNAKASSDNRGSSPRVTVARRRWCAEQNVITRIVPVLLLFVSPSVRMPKMPCTVAILAQGTNWADAVTQAYTIACFRATHAHSGTICSNNNNKARGSSPHNAKASSDNRGSSPRVTVARRRWCVEQFATTRFVAIHFSFFVNAEDVLHRSHFGSTYKLG